MLLLLLLFTPAVLRFIFSFTFHIENDCNFSVETEGNPLSNGNNPTEEKVEFASAIDGDPEVKKKDNGVVWSDWIVALVHSLIRIVFIHYSTPCSDTCGACGMTHLIRECLCAGEEGCPCRFDL